MNTAPQDPHGWADYYDSQPNRAPRPFLLDVVRRCSDVDSTSATPLDAIDLGCGDGAESLELLRRGWTVLAIDAQQAAVDRLIQAVPVGDRPRLTTQVDDFTHLTLPPADLIYCGWSLPHCPAAHFGPLWASIRSALRPSGRFAGQILGSRDDWAKSGAAAFSQAQIARLLDKLTVESFDETEEDRESFDGVKHWHYFDVIAQQPHAN